MSVNGENDGDGVNRIDDFGSSELSRIGEQYKRVPYAQRDLKRRLREARYTVNGVGDISEHQSNLDALRDLLKGTKDPDGRRDINAYIKETEGTIRDIKGAHSTIEKIPSRLRMYRESTRERLNAQAVNTVSRGMSDRSVGSYVNGYINSYDTQVAGLSMATQSSFEDLSTRREGIMSEIGRIRGESINTAHSLIGPKGINADADRTLKENAEKVKELASQLGPIAVAMKQLKQEGKDPDGVRAKLTRYGEKAQDYLAYEGLSKDIREGKGEFGNLSPADMKKKETEAAQNLVKALDELRNASGKSKEELSKLTKAAEEAADRFEEVQDAKSAGGGRGGGDGLRTGAAVASAVAGVAQLVGNAFQVLGINQPMANMSNVSGYAAIENRKHDSWRAALAGNMTERLNLMGWDSAREFGLNRATAAGWKVGADITGGIAGTVAGVAQTADAVSNGPGGGTVGKVMGTSQVIVQTAQGVLATGESALQTAASIQDARNKISTSQAEIAGNWATMDAVSRVNHIPGYQLQQYRDHMIGFYGASSNMGRRGEGFMGKVTGVDFIGSMDAFGLGSEEAASLSNFGSQNIGSLFDAQQIIQAKRFENLGLGSSGDNMRRMAVLASGGSQNPAQSLEKLLERAVATGLDSSKSITMIAESTGTVAEQSALRGMAGVGDEISRMLYGAADRNNPNQEIAAKQAITAFQTGEGARNNRSASWHGMVAVSRLQKEFGFQWEDAYGLQGMSVAELRKLKSMSGDDARATLFRRGVNASGNNNFNDANIGTSLDKVIEAKVLSQAEANGGFAFEANKAWQDVILPFAKGSGRNAALVAGGNRKQLPANVYSALGAIYKTAAANGNDGGAVVREMLSALGLIDSGSAGIGLGASDQDFGVGGARGAVAQDIQLGAKSQMGAAREAAKKASGGTGAGIDAAAAIRDSGTAALNSPGADAERRWSEAAAKSAEDFGASATKLSNAGDRLMDAAKALMAAARIRDLAGQRPSDEMPEGINQSTSKVEE